MLISSVPSETGLHKNSGADEVHDESLIDWHSTMRFDLAFVAKAGLSASSHGFLC